MIRLDGKNRVVFERPKVRFRQIDLSDQYLDRPITPKIIKWLLRSIRISVNLFFPETIDDQLETILFDQFLSRG